MNELTPSQLEQLDDIFTYHPATDAQKAQYDAINTAAKAFAKVILEQCPRSADRSTAFRLVRETRMWANASVACNGRAMPDGC